MKLYLSSYHLGRRASEFARLFPQNKKIALISNALDFSSDNERRAQSTQREITDLLGIGLEPEDFDLRQYFGKPDDLEKKLNEFKGIWMRGGNTFILRRALAQSGLDTWLLENKHTDFVCSGYSAGACVVSQTLRGIDLADDPLFIPDGYFSEIIWKGVGLVPYSIAPHFRSDHPESALIEKSVEYFQKNNMPFVTLRDGEDILEEIL